MTQTTRVRRCSAAIALLSFVVAQSCLPYAMASTAATIPRDEQRTTFSVAPAFGDRSADGPIETPVIALDAETRIGISDRSDAGLRITSLSGAVVSYKQRLLGSSKGAALSAQVEGGIVKGGRQAMGGVSVLASTDDWRRQAIYGGGRYLSVTRLQGNVVRESATAGAFIGMQLRRRSFILLPELSVVRGFDDVIAHRAVWLVIPTFSIARAPRSITGSRR